MDALRIPTGDAANNSGRVRALWAAVVAAAILTGAAGLGIAQGGDQVQPATILRVRGDVSIRPAGAEVWRRANERERILPGTRIRTGDASEAILQLSDRNLVRIGDRTEIALDVALVRREVDPGNSAVFFPARRDVHQFDLNLPEGNAASVLRGLRGNSRYDLHTPVATAGARGTVFVADVKRAGRGAGPGGARGQGTGGVTANFTCLEGSINVTGSGFPAGGLLVPTGFNLLVTGTEAGAGGVSTGGGPSPATGQVLGNANDAAAPAEVVLEQLTNSSDNPLTTDLQSGGVDDPAKGINGYGSQN